MLLVLLKTLRNHLLSLLLVFYAFSVDLRLHGDQGRNESTPVMGAILAVNVKDSVSQNRRASSSSAFHGNLNQLRQEASPFTYLKNVLLFKNGEFYREILEGDVITITRGDKYGLVVASGVDFGSVLFDLENFETGMSDRSLDNKTPYIHRLFSTVSSRLLVRDLEYEFQLDLTAFNADGLEGDILETRSIRFSVQVAPTL